MLPFMEQLITGIHHVTALAADPQKNLEFYSGILGLRLIKKTVNFDAPEVYHLYYGNEQGTPGTLLTFFPYPGLSKGRKGKGQLTTTSFSIPKNGIEYWLKRLNKFHVQHGEPEGRFDDEMCISFEDHEGLGLELVANQRDERVSISNPNIPLEYAIRGFYGITLSEEGYESTAQLLSDLLDHSSITSQGNRFRYSPSNKPGSFVDIVCCPDQLRGMSGAGTVHHVAFATATDENQLRLRQRLYEEGYNVTPIIDREYFHSIYFREPGGVLFEVATLPPGFTIDEEFTHLGESLKLPPWQEKNRKWIEGELPPLHLDLKAFVD